MHDSIIKKTGQLWKLRLSIYAFFAGCGSEIVGWLLLSTTSTLNIGFIFFLAGIHLMFGSFIFPTVAIRCPACRAQWIWQWTTAARKKSGDLVAGLLRFSQCPRCGYQGEPTKEATE